MRSFLERQIKNPKLRELAEWIIALMLAAALYFLLQQFVFRTAKVVGVSMEPTLFHGERLVLLKVPYLFGDPGYNDIVAFPFKEDPKQRFIKRIIGLPGDLIDFEDSRFTVNGSLLENDYNTATTLGSVSLPLTVPEGSYFVLGDNRNSSKDSRYQEVGCIPKSMIIGKAVLRFWPLDKFGIIEKND